MKTTLKLALGAVLSAAVIVPAVAQDNFPDVPGEHWAYDALARMKREGLLVGYPDGLFRGNRPASRYELAVAIHATYSHLKGLIDGINAQIDELKNRPGGSDQELRDALAQLQADVNNMKSWGDDIANLKRMASEFEKELAAMGVNVDQMKQQLSDLESRVGVLERNKLPVNVHGDVNALMLGGISNNDRAFIGQDGRIYGVNPFSGGPAGLSQDLNIYHEAALQLTSNNETGPKWKGTFVFANTMPGIQPTSVGSGVGIPGAVTGGASEAGPSDMWIDDLTVTFDTSVGGQGFTAELGRFGYMVSDYIWKRQDTTPYYANSRWDDGKWRTDGANLGFHFGMANLNVFGGRTADLNTVNGTPIQGGLSFPGTVMGAHLGVPVTENGKINLAYIWQESNGPVGPNFVRLETFGGDLKWDWQNFNLMGGYSQTNLKSGATKVNRDNYAWHVGAGYESDRWGVNVAWREIMPNFAAAGDWGRIGFIYNPVDLRGIMAKAHFDFNDTVRLQASGEWYEGTNKGLHAYFGGGDIFDTDDDIRRYTASLDYRLNESWSAMLGGEWVDFALSAPSPRPQFRWYNIGFGYAMSDMAKLNFMWQWADHDGDGAALLPAGLGGQRSTGSLLTTQLTVKF
jgi:hypothetical protein